MKNKILASGVVFFTGIFLTAALLYHQNLVNIKSKLAVEPIDNKGIFVGEKQKMIKDAPDHVGDYWKQVKAIDDASAYETSGNAYYRDSDFEKAAQEYKKAYLIGDRAVSGFKLAETYEKLGRYNEAIDLLNNMVKNRELSELGIQDAKEMISRLLAAKNQSFQNQTPQNQTQHKPDN